MLDRRVHLLLDEERYRKVADTAKRRGISTAAVIRELIDHLPSEEELARRRAAWEEFLAAEPIHLPADPAELRRELDEAHDRVRD